MARLAHIQTMGTERTVTDGPTIESDNRMHSDSSRSHFSGSSGEQAQEGNRREGYGPDVRRDFPALARLRTTVEDRSPKRRDWSDYAIIAGTFLLAGAILMTLLLALGINARANRLVDTDAARATTSGQTVSRLEGKLDAHIATLDAHVATTTTVTTTLPRGRGRATGTTAPPRRMPTPSPPRATTTTRPPAPPPPSTTPTTRPCSLALLNLCLAR
jgi:hypothetical protein